MKLQSNQELFSIGMPEHSLECGWGTLDKFHGR